MIRPNFRCLGILYAQSNLKWSRWSWPPNCFSFIFVIRVKIFAPTSLTSFKGVLKKIQYADSIATRSFNGGTFVLYDKPLMVVKRFVWAFTVVLLAIAMHQLNSCCYHPPRATPGTKSTLLGRGWGMFQEVLSRGSRVGQVEVPPRASWATKWLEKLPWQNWMAE